MTAITNSQTADKSPQPNVFVVVAVFALALVAVVALRGRALTTPYFWDEVGYYIPNALSMARNHLYPIPTNTVPQSYPPLQPLTLVAGWWVLGTSIAATRIVGFFTTALALTVTCLLGREVSSPAAGIAAAATTLATPVFLGQTGFAQPEILLALFTVAAALALIRDRMGWHAVAVTLLLMTKWTAIIALPAFGIYILWHAPTWREGLRKQLWYVPGLGLLAIWLAFFHHVTGTFTSTDTHYARVNLWDNLNAQALVQRGAIRIEQLGEMDGAWLLYAPILVAGAVWCWRRGTGRSPSVTPRSAQLAMLAGVCALYVAFLTVSGFLLPRYFVPVLPLFAVLAATALFELLPRTIAAAVSTATVALLLLTWYGWFPSRYPPLLDMRPAYMDVVDAHRLAARYLEANVPDARIAATWPVLDVLRNSDFGYVTHPLETLPLDSLPAGPDALDRFDVLFEAPIPQNPNPARERALELGLVEFARFRVGDGVAILWQRPPAATAAQAPAPNGGNSKPAVMYNPSP